MIRSSRIIAACVAILSIVATGAVAEVSTTRAHSAKGGKQGKPRSGVRRVATIADATVSPSASGADQADALQEMLDGLQTGQRLRFSPGQYVAGHSLVVRNQQVVVSGYGATLVATNANDQAVVMNGRDSTVAGLTLRGTGSQRLETASSAKVVVSGAGIQVLDVTIQGGASAGIFVSGGTGVAIVGNTVLSTLADGIHVTGRSRDVLVQSNTVTGIGDDMVAVVSYEHDGVLSRNVLVTGNTLSGNTWGRGVSVVGGSNVTISGNTVQGVQKAAGILVAQEDGYRTYSATNIVIADNVISDIENSANPGNDRPVAQHAAIDLNAGSGSVMLVSVTGNQIKRANYGGFRALGNVCQYRVSGDTFTSIAGAAVSLQSRGCSMSQIICGTNTQDGKPLVPPVGCSATGTLSIVGADASLLPPIRTSVRQTQQTLIKGRRTLKPGQATTNATRPAG